MNKLMETQAHVSPNPVLQLHNVDVSVGAGNLLHDLNVTISSGDFVGLLGPNGAGKTTLLKVFLGLLAPARGTVTLFREPVQRGNRHIGYVPQKIHIDVDTPLTGRDLVGLGWDGHKYGFPWPNRKRTNAIDDALAAVNATGFADVPVGRLSGGQQQRLLIAQALVSRPQLLLLDEPLSNLDIKSANEIVSLLGRISRDRGLAVILVAHDINPLLGSMNKVLYLARGQGAMGSVEEVIQTSVLSRLYGYDVEVLRVKGRIMVVGNREEEGNVEDLTGCLHCDGQEQTAP